MKVHKACGGCQGAAAPHRISCVLLSHAADPNIYTTTTLRSAIENAAHHCCQKGTVTVRTRPITSISAQDPKESGKNKAISAAGMLKMMVRIADVLYSRAERRRVGLLVYVRLAPIAWSPASTQQTIRGPAAVLSCSCRLLCVGAM